MSQQQKITTDSHVSIAPFQWQDWNALWQLRSYQLAEHGIRLDALPAQPDFNSLYEQDYHRLDQVYLSGRGNFWIAWASDTPVGHIGAQDVGDYVELRRMYVRVEYRRCGVGTALVQTLIAHCATHSVSVIELWTDEQGPGHFLYAKLGFCEVELADQKAKVVANHPRQIRMHLALNE